jgi:hypothetical protein
MDSGTKASTNVADRRAESWAPPVGALSVHPDQPGAIVLDGRRLIGPVQGFGQLWRKRYTARLGTDRPSPAELMSVWRDEFASFWPPQNHFHAPLAGLRPGEVAALEVLAPPGLTLSTGVLVLYADEVSLTLMTPQGHMFAGWVTFSAERDADGSTAASVEVLMRAADPLTEAGLVLLGGHREEDHHWQYTLAAVARRFGIETVVDSHIECVDAGRQWRRVTNLRYDPVLWSVLLAGRAPWRNLRRRLGRP